MTRVNNTFVHMQALSSEPVLFGSHGPDYQDIQQTVRARGEWQYFGGPVKTHTKTCYQ